MHLLDSAGKFPELEYICNLHEQASAIAAQGYGCFTANLGVVICDDRPRRNEYSDRGCWGLDGFDPLSFYFRAG